MIALTPSDRAQAVQGLTLMAFAYALTVPLQLLATLLFRPSAQSDIFASILVNAAVYTTLLLLPMYGLWLLREFASSAKPALTAGALMIVIEATRTWLVGEMFNGGDSALMRSRGWQCAFACVVAVAETATIHMAISALLQATARSGGRASKVASGVVYAALTCTLASPFTLLLNMDALSSAELINFRSGILIAHYSISIAQTAGLAYLAYRARAAVAGMLLEPQSTAESAYRGPTELA